SSEVWFPCSPIFRSTWPTRNPGNRLSTAKAEMPLLPFDRSVIAMTVKRPPSGPLVMSCFVPFREYRSLLRSAVVAIRAASQLARLREDRLRDAIGFLDLGDHRVDFALDEGADGAAERVQLGWHGEVHGGAAVSRERLRMATQASRSRPAGALPPGACVLTVV